MRSGKNGDIDIARLFWIFNDAELVLSYPSTLINLHGQFKEILDLTLESGTLIKSQQTDPFNPES